MGDTFYRFSAISIHGEKISMEDWIIFTVSIRKKVLLLSLSKTMQYEADPGWRYDT
jgi:hypothetical protein